METPGMEALRRHVPSARIDVLGARPATDLLMRDPRVDEVWSIQDFGFGHWGDEGYPNIREAFKRWLKAKKYDAVLDPSHAACGARQAIWEYGGPLFDARDEYPDPVIREGGCGIQAIKKAFFRGWGIHVPEEWMPRIHVGLRDHLWARKFLHLRLRERRILIALSPAGSSSPKIWPIERMAQLGERLIGRGFNVLLLGGLELREHSSLFELKRSERAAVAEEMHLLRVAALLGECNGLICNDTGLMHIAATVGTPVIGLFGPTEPSIYLPRQQVALAVAGDRPHCEFRERTGIRPSRCQTVDRCLNGEVSCICAIKVEEVLSVVEEILHRRQSPHLAAL